MFMVEIKLNSNDKKILAYLYHSSRDPATKIAKNLHMTREQVAYRIKKFEDEKIIKGYIPLVDYSKLGYRNVVLFFVKFKKQKQIQEFKDLIKSEPRKLNIVDTLAKYDLGILFIFKDEKERNDYLGNILESNNEKIDFYDIIEPYYSQFYPLKFLGYKESPKEVDQYSQSRYVLDEKEKNILKQISKNANAKIIDIAKESKLSAELVVYKLKRLKEEGVLITTRAYFDMEKIGFSYTIILIELPNFSNQNQIKLKKFARENDNVDSLMLNFGKPNSYIQIFHKEITQLKKFVEDLRKAFSEDSLEITIIPLKNEGEDINTLPFI